MKPTVIVYVSTTLDGCTTGFDVDLAVHYSIAQRIGEDATLAGCESMLIASSGQVDPEAVEPPPAQPDDPRPVLVVVDSRGRLQNWAYWKRQPMFSGWIALCSRMTPAAHLDDLDRLGVTRIVAGEDRIDLRRALSLLRSEHGIERIRVESGGVLNGVLLDQGLVDEVHLLVHPILLGDPEARTFAEGLGGRRRSLNLDLIDTEVQAGDRVLMRYTVRKD